MALGNYRIRRGSCSYSNIIPTIPGSAVIKLEIQGTCPQCFATRSRRAKYEAISKL